MRPVVGWLRGVRGVDAGAGEMGLMVGFHAAYGVVLGAFPGAGVLGVLVPNTFGTTTFRRDTEPPV